MSDALLPLCHEIPRHFWERSRFIFKAYNGGHNRCGEAVSELMCWLSAGAGKPKTNNRCPYFLCQP